MAGTLVFTHALLAVMVSACILYASFFELPLTLPEEVPENLLHLYSCLLLAH